MTRTATPKETPTADVATLDPAAELAATKERLAQMEAQVAEFLARKQAETDAPKPEEAKALPTRKLLFIDEDSLVPNEVYGPMYGCAKGGTPVVFKGNESDRRPHALVHQSFGDFLIETDRPVNGRGGYTSGPRYAWAEAGE